MDKTSDVIKNAEEGMTIRLKRRLGVEELYNAYIIEPLVVCRLLGGGD